MRKEFFLALAQRLRERLGDDIQHIDLWNHNVEFIEQEIIWSRPAVFVEFGSIQWTPLADPEKVVMRGEGTITLHIVTDWVGSIQPSGRIDQEALAYLDLPERIQSALLGLEGDRFHGFALLSEESNHNHEELVEDLSTYRIRWTKTL